MSRRANAPFEEGDVVVQNYATLPFSVDDPLIVLQTHRVYANGYFTKRWRVFVTMTRVPKGWLLAPKGWLPAESLTRL